MVMRRRNVREINADARIFDEASRIREYHANQPEKRKVTTPDATHLATAALYEADEFLTMDGLKKGGQNKRKLIALSGDVGGHNLSVVHPYSRNAPPPPELVGIGGPLIEKAISDSKLEKAKATDEGGPQPEATQGLKTRKIALDKDI
jgi:hypothetical protein